MATLEQELSAWLTTAFQAAFPEQAAAMPGIIVLPSSRPEFGDFQCEAAMGMAKTLKRPPRQVAETAKAAAAPSKLVARIEVAGPGFLNLFLEDSAISELLQTMADDPRLGVPEPGVGKTILLDYSSPNVAKPMHIGHIRSTVIGNALDRLFRFLGYKVVSDNHLGDWGTQFGILIMGYKNFLDAAAFEAEPVDELERLYVASYERTKTDPAWLDACRAELVKLQSGDAENMALWKRFVQASLDEFERIYRRLGVSFDLTRGESHYHAALPGVLEKLEKAGLAAESEGAQVAFLEEEKLPPCIVRKKDGGFNYAATDVATVLSRQQEFNPDKVVYVTDERQQLHFRQVFAIARRLGVTTELEHVWFGLMRLPEGVFSTRQGNVIKLERLLDEAETRALALIRQSSPDMPADEQTAVARAVGIGAVKYADLSQNPQSAVVFTWDKALALDGNSAPYLQYACARIRAVEDKYRERFPNKDFRNEPIVVAEPLERALALRVLRFGDAALQAARAYRPSALADYLFDLAQAYSAFYQNVPFLKAEPGARESRVRICLAVAAVLRQGLALLGISTPDRI